MVIINKEDILQKKRNDCEATIVSLELQFYYAFVATYFSPLNLIPSSRR